MDKSAILCHHGLSLLKSKNTPHAIAKFTQSLHQNPFLFTSIEKLAFLGYEMNLDEIISVETVKSFLARMNFSDSSILKVIPQQEEQIPPPPPPVSTSSTSTSTTGKKKEPKEKIPKVAKKSSRSNLKDPPIVAKRGMVTRTASKSNTASTTSTDTAKKKRTRGVNVDKMDIDVDVQSSKKLTTQKGKSSAVASSSKSGNSNSIGSGSNGSISAEPSLITYPESVSLPLPTQDPDDPLQPLIQTLKKLYRSVIQLSKFQCLESIETLSTLDADQFNTAWVYGQIGRAYFEIAEYAKCETAYVRMRELEPWRTEGVDYFSTALWHLKKEVQLSYLANEMVDVDKLCSQTW
ncbi:anaphase-promoting complex subunit cdc27 [Nowakowskiella sp. JEL0407]|nr:anaphase-promoting complex subunit cdc27 [Nowakowskiella sp. JEL0407]